MKMRELELRTGVNREVIRILIRQGLLAEPQRPSRNAAEYDETHVRGIATIRELQQSSRLTLKEIKAALRGDAITGNPPSSAFGHLDQLLAAKFGLDEPSPIFIETIEDRYPHARHDAEAFCNLGMVEIVEREGRPALSLADIRLVQIWGEIREAGFVEAAGFPPENIAFYLDAAKFVARQEARIFFENSRTPIREEQAASMLHIALPLMLEFFGLLRLREFIAASDAPVRQDAAFNKQQS